MTSATSVTAADRALAILHGMVLQQASMVSYVMLFRLLGIIFLAMLPLVMIMRKAKARGAPIAAH
jgi:DHA2 family multidrug resistance protein